MKIKWLGHASFLITSESGLRIVTDPYQVVGGLSYNKIQETADIVTVSHDHSDHNNAAEVKGNPQVVRGAGTHKAKGVEFKGIATYHDPSRGSERGSNVIFCFAVDGIRVCHLGDLGHPLNDLEVREVGAVDVLLAPVGGFYTIDAATATRVGEQLKPRVLIPMHYKTPKCAYPISSVEDFVKGKASVRRQKASEVELKKETLPVATEIVVLEPSN